ILDVVYNHTAEGDHIGPTLSFRGIDNRSYYRLVPGDERLYEDFTGCGNALRLHHPRVLQLVTDSLRYWVEEMHVDGFRFDLATTLAREAAGGFDRHSGFLDVLRQDPELARVKLIAEPWDLGPDGYRLGGFPPDWAEWNDKFRDTVRRFWKGEGGLIRELAARISGSQDLFGHAGRRPWSSVNFVTAHDGFTLRDLVSYEKKHNEANGEENRDGSDNNQSFNCGAEGPTDDPGIRQLRDRQRRNFVATMLLSQGTPMLGHGDEMGRTQGGNNNGYCQDNETTWVDWDNPDPGMTEFVQRVAALRRDHAVFRRKRFFDGRPVRRIAGTPLRDIAWFTPAGHEMAEDDWGMDFGRAVAVFLNGEGITDRDSRGERITDDSFLLCFNAHHEPLEFTAPSAEYGEKWRTVLDTATGQVTNGAPEEEGTAVTHASDTLTVEGRSLVVLIKAI
ncbi:MAG: glycogen debranching enzyme, partial [Mycolicibacterium aromaticivorans]|nr:glycogen debranching enzyme [Mycolicibacterium aromaticivorans]